MKTIIEMGYKRVPLFRKEYGMDCPFCGEWMSSEELSVPNNSRIIMPISHIENNKGCFRLCNPNSLVGKMINARSNSHWSTWDAVLCDTDGDLWFLKAPYHHVGNENIGNGENGQVEVAPLPHHGELHVSLHVEWLEKCLEEAKELQKTLGLK